MTRLCVITGAAGGIGQALSRLMVADGVRTVLIDQRREPLDKLASDLAATGPQPLVMAIDLRDEIAITRAFESVRADHGPVTMLVNNAAILDNLAPVAEMSTEMWHDVLAVNLTAPFITCRSVLPHMVEFGHGTIVNIASIAGLRGGRAGPAYTASKFGLIGLTKNIAAMYASAGVRCNAVCPGSVKTGIGTGVTIHAGGRAFRERDQHLKPPQAAPQQIAAVASFLLSDAASYINGAEILADGGYLAF